MSPAVKNGLLLVVLVVILGVAGWFFSKRSKETGYPDTGPKTQWMCDSCGKHYELSPAEYKEWLDSPDKLRRDRSMGSQVVFWCDDCQKYSVVRAKVHKPTGKWYLSADSQGNPLPTPKWLEEWVEKQHAGG